jgi:nicotinamidase-related amidase/type 1 glutamine amidotransferase
MDLKFSRIILIVSIVIASALEAGESRSFALNLRNRIELGEKGSGYFNVQWKSAEWDASKTAVVICDMWDKHWCPGATARVGEMAPRMNELVVEARKRGALIIHCPSDTMDYYKDTPQFKLAQSAPVVDVKVPLLRWRKLDPDHEAPLPITDSDGGCDCDTPVKNFKAWSHQIDTIKIEANDAITDTAQAYHLMRKRGIENVLVMGVHLNMCVLGRPFSIRQLCLQGLNVVLVRDMTDTMYNPKSKPNVSHFTGNDLMVAHVEKYWCPTVTSADILGCKEFRFADDKRPRLLMLIAEDEYKTNDTLPAFALKNLGNEFSVSYAFGGLKGEHHLQGLEQIKDADALLISVRRRVLQKDQTTLLKQFAAAGKPIIGIRTACHAFEPMKKETPPEGCEPWLGFDTEIFGCHYANHYGAGSKTQVSLAANAKENPILKGVEPTDFTSSGSLYKVAPLKPNAVSLLNGVSGTNPAECVAWTLIRDNGQRVFYTTLGHPDDFTLPQFETLLTNGIRWAVGK